MSKQEIFDYINKMYLQWKELDADDLSIAEGIERNIIHKIMRFAYNNNLAMPGYDMNEIFAFIDRDEDADDYDPDDDDYDLIEIYCEISRKLEKVKTSFPPDFTDLIFYFENLFWNDEDDINQDGCKSL